VHVHAPFEQLLTALTAGLAEPGSLDGGDFTEAEAMRAAEASGSRSGIFVLSVAVGLCRFHFGRHAEASQSLERARAYLDAASSVWHVPILHQFAALSACAAAEGAGPDDRAALRAHAEASLAALRTLSSHCAANFAHRVTLVEAALARLDGDDARALALLERAKAEAQEGSWLSDVALASELAARSDPQPDGPRRRLRAARMAYAAWGATAKADHLAIP
jgi:hypothetical protein